MVPCKNLTVAIPIEALVIVEYPIVAVFVTVRFVVVVRPKLEFPLMFRLVPVTLPPERFIAVVAVAAFPKILAS